MYAVRYGEALYHEIAAKFAGLRQRKGLRSGDAGGRVGDVASRP